MKKKILFLGDSPVVATGFGNVSRNLLTQLKKLDPELDITVIGINCFGGWYDMKEYPMKIYTAVYSDFEDTLGFKRLLKVLEGKDPEIKENDFDILILSFDSWCLANVTIGGEAFIQRLRMTLEASEKKMLTVLYTPIDNPQIPPGWIETMKVFDIVATPSKYGKAMITATDKELGNRVKIIYNGLDTENFYPIKNFKKVINLGETKIDLTDRYVIGFVGRNQWRKDYFHLVKIFTEFKKKHKEAFLYMHTNPVDFQHDGGDIYELCRYFGLQLGEDYYVPVDHEDNKGIPRQGMNEVYNMMDVFLSCSLGEGFGLPYVEAMLAGVPVILPENTTSEELLRKPGGDLRGLMYKTKNTVCFGSFDLMRERPLPDPDLAFEALEIMYSRKQAGMKETIKLAREFALTITAEKMGKEFYELLA